MKRIALTFDDGPGRETMPRILDLLNREGAKATFFLWGEKICEETLPVLRRALAEGHELANHSMRHLHMSRLTETEMAEEVENLQGILKRLLDVEPKLFRPPYLDCSDAMLRRIGLPMIFGSPNRDWMQETDAHQRLRLAMEATRDGGILLMHCFDSNGATVEALETLLPWLREEGYIVTTVSSLFEAKGITPLAGNIYHKVP